MFFCQKHNTMNLLFMLFFYFFFHPHIYYRAEKNEETEDFLGVSLIEWTEDGKIKNLKEFMCKLNNYDPYEKSDIPEFIYT